MGIVESYVYTHGWPQSESDIGIAFKEYETIRGVRRKTLTEWNKILDNAEFLKADRKQLEKAETAELKLPVKRESVTHDDPEAASRNREILANLYPGMIQKRDIASTLVVHPYDQKARWQWLVVWSFVLSLGLVMNRLSKFMPSAYGFYQSRIANFFRHGSGTVSLAQMEPTNQGLPHPLYLGSLMQPGNKLGSYRVDQQPFIFSPIYCGDLDDPAKLWKTQDVSPDIRGSSLTLADAVTISGAAVTPLMSGNRYLSLILSFFGTGLGRWLRWRNPGQDPPQSTVVKRPNLAQFLVIFVLAGCFISGIILGWIATSVALLLALILILSWRRLDGTFAMLMALMRPGHKRKGDNLIGHVADGGFHDYLGVFELLRRRCALIIVSDAGAHLNNDSLRPLARLCEYASTHMGIKILDLDHESPVDFRRLALTDTRKVHQPFLCARIRYPDSEPGRQEPALLVYCQMAITEEDPLEIQQIRNRFPSFPDEPTSNQFYTDDQVAAYRNLGYHIASRMCSELQRWRPEDIQKWMGEDDWKKWSIQQRQPLLPAILQRLKTSFRLACHQELSYRDNDIFSEAIWAVRNPATPTLEKFLVEFRKDSARSVKRGPIENDVLPEELALRVCDRWLKVYEENADARAKYRDAVVQDINCVDDMSNSQSSTIIRRMFKDFNPEELPLARLTMGCHLTGLAVACHEIHMGRPTHVFQIGGREKLMSLALSLANGLVPLQTDAQGMRKTVQNLVAELLELKKCTFQGSGLATTVSLAHCMVMMWGRISHDERISAKDESEPYDEKDPAVVQIKKHGIELAVADVRIGLHKSLEENRVEDVVKAIEKGWLTIMISLHDHPDHSKK